jgi:hypothetical protein
MHTEDKEPDGIAEGETSNASQQSKHFQCGSATVLCTTVNSTAQPCSGTGELADKTGCRVLAVRSRRQFPGQASVFPEVPSASFLDAPRH